jgi:DNA-binding phage protein
MDNQSKLAEKLSAVLPYLNERQQRLLLAAEASSLGYGGVTQVSRASGVSRPTIYRGLRERLEESEEFQMVRLRLWWAETH